MQIPLLRLLLTCPAMAGMCLVAMASAQAQESPHIAPANQGDDSSVEAARTAVRSASEWLASGVDSWFGSKPFSEGG